MTSGSSICARTPKRSSPSTSIFLARMVAKRQDIGLRPRRRRRRYHHSKDVSGSGAEEILFKLPVQRGNVAGSPRPKNCTPSAGPRWEIPDLPGPWRSQRPRTRRLAQIDSFVFWEDWDTTASHCLRTADGWPILRTNRACLKFTLYRSGRPGRDAFDRGRQMAGIERGRDGAGLARRRQRTVFYQQLSGQADVGQPEHHRRPFSARYSPIALRSRRPSDLELLLGCPGRAEDLHGHLWAGQHGALHSHNELAGLGKEMNSVARYTNEILFPNSFLILSVLLGDFLPAGTEPPERRTQPVICFPLALQIHGRKGRRSGRTSDILAP